MNTPKIINILSPHAYGGTFLDWTLHYLAGHDCVYSGIGTSVGEGHRPLSKSPINEINAHGHIKNHPCGYAEASIAMERLRAISSDEFHSIYSFFLPITDAVASKAHELDCELLWDYLCDYNDMTIWLSIPSDNKMQLYMDTTKKRIKSNHRSRMTFNDHFKHSQDKWEELGLTDIWDRRELMALNNRPFGGFKHKLDFSKKHIYVNPIDLMASFEYEIENLMERLHIPVSLSRLAPWREVYSSWKKIHNPRIQWINYFDHIIECIVHGYNMDIERFDLDIQQESTIQHVLIYKYGLNLKTWGLDVFPKNTKDIHSLLEENTHPIEKYDVPI